MCAPPRPWRLMPVPTPIVLEVCCSEAVSIDASLVLRQATRQHERAHEYLSREFCLSLRAASSTLFVFTHLWPDPDPRPDTEADPDPNPAQSLKGHFLPRQVLLPHYKEPWFIARAVQRYRQFLYLKVLHRKTFIVPPFDVDLLWHLHMVRTS